MSYMITHIPRINHQSSIIINNHCFISFHPHKMQLQLAPFFLYIYTISSTSSNSAKFSTNPSIIDMWSNLPFDILAEIFSHLPPESFIRAKSVCKNWLSSTAAPPPPRRQIHMPPWFVAFPSRAQERVLCYAHNPTNNNWHILKLNLITQPQTRPVSSVSGLVLLKTINTTRFDLWVCNPFTRQFRQLPNLKTPRINPAVGVVETEESQSFRIYVAGGGCGGASYVPTVEVYNSGGGGERWEEIGAMPVEYAVRLTVWTPNESVFINGVIYWMTSARAYSVMGFEVEGQRWRQMSVPMGDRLEFASLVARNGKLVVVGGRGRYTDVFNEHIALADMPRGGGGGGGRGRYTDAFNEHVALADRLGGGGGGGGWVWELGEGGGWGVIEKVPLGLEVRLLGEKGSWGSVKCVGSDGVVCLYRDVRDGIVVWRECVGSSWEWCWVEGCGSIVGSNKLLHNFPIKGLVLHPNLRQTLL